MSFELLQGGGGFLAGTVKRDLFQLSNCTDLRD